MPVPYELLFLGILALIVISIPFSFRALRRPRVGSSSKYRRAYIAATLRCDPVKYKYKYLNYREALSVWFDPPLVEEFGRKALRLQKLLKERGNNPEDAPKVWAVMLEHHPAYVVSMEPDDWMAKGVPLGSLIEEK